MPMLWKALNFFDFFRLNVLFFANSNCKSILNYDTISSESNPIKYNHTEYSLPKKRSQQDINSEFHSVSPRLVCYLTLGIFACRKNHNLLSEGRKLIRLRF